MSTDTNPLTNAPLTLDSLLNMDFSPVGQRFMKLEQTYHSTNFEE